MSDVNRDNIIDLMNENTRLLAEIDRLRGLLRRVFSAAKDSDTRSVSLEWLETYIRPALSPAPESDVPWDTETVAYNQRHGTTSTSQAVCPWCHGKGVMDWCHDDTCELCHGTGRKEGKR